MKKLIGFVCLCSLSNALMAQGIVTLTMASNTNSSDSLSITSQQFARVKSAFFTIPASGYNNGCNLLIQKAASTFQISLLCWMGDGVGYRDFTVAGPAIISITNNTSLAIQALATVDVQPSTYPPDKAVTVGSYSGNVRVTMEMSTDLVNWAPAVNAAVYTNSPDARFFRIRLAANASL